jgi:hypothetical protein
MEAKGALPHQIAARHGQILLGIAPERLPDGTSIIDLAPGCEEWEMDVTVKGKTETLSRSLLRFRGVTVYPREIPIANGVKGWRLTIKVESPPS